MSKILLMTVGTGVGPVDSKSKNLAHGLDVLISNVEPDFTVFVGSEASEKTVHYIKEKYFQTHQEDLKYDFVTIHEVDNFNYIYDKFTEQIIKYQKDKVVMDYTSGTKTMTMVAALCSMLYNKRLYFVHGERDGEGNVIPGSEQVISQNLYKAYDKIKIDQIKEYFNTYRYESAQEVLNTVVNYPKKSSLDKLIEVYGAWDKFDHEIALKSFDEKIFKDFPDINTDLGMNIESLRNINSDKSVDKCYFILASLINNAHRRYEEGRYDDGIARLYRSVELIAQILLKEYNLNPSNLNISLIKEKYPTINTTYYENKITNDKKIKLGLVDDYKLLKCLNNKVGIYFMDNYKVYQNFLSNRNKSILAHGLENKTKKDYEDFEEFVILLSKKVKEDIERFLTQTSFPKFKT